MEVAAPATGGAAGIGVNGGGGGAPPHCCVTGCCKDVGAPLTSRMACCGPLGACGALEASM